MRVKLFPDTERGQDATITHADGCVWQEAFTRADLDGLRTVLEVGRGTVPTPLLAAYDRLTLMLVALTNDSDACIVTQVEDET